ncbi:MAG: hypothetical protein H6728_15710 [Myxococcales bacterium]|nr:hypothetical protein [Myxococcales bacterium]MCB9644519.1 hypothetical protein [Myxococcales bacterium]
MAETPRNEERTPRRRAPLRKSAPRRVQPDVPAEHGVFKEAWLRYHDFYNGFMPHPGEFARGEDQGATEMGLVRIPALIFYAPIYYIFLLVLFPLFYPFMLISAISSKKSPPPSA